MGYKMVEPTTNISLVDTDRLELEARLTRLETTNQHVLDTLGDLKEDVGKIAAQLNELHGELKGRRLVNGNSSGNSMAVLKYLVIALTSALLSLVGVKIAHGGA